MRPKRWMLWLSAAVKCPSPHYITAHSQAQIKGDDNRVQSLSCLCLIITKSICATLTLKRPPQRKEAAATASHTSRFVLSLLTSAATSPARPALYAETIAELCHASPALLSHIDSQHASQIVNYYLLFVFCIAVLCRKNRGN